MQIIFFGSDQYSLLVLKCLAKQENLVVKLVVTTRPKPVGRDHVPTPTPVEKYAVNQNIKVSYYPNNIEEISKFINMLEITPSTHGLSASFPRIVPHSLVLAFAGRLYNLHPSLLPQYRNVAPVPYAIALGEHVTGITLFRIGEGIDNGQILTQIEEPIYVIDTTPILLTRLFEKGVDLFINWLVNPTLVPTPQPHRETNKLIFTRKLTRDSGYVEWPVILKLIENSALSPLDTNNPLVKLRLTHFPDRNNNVLFDLIRALEGYEKIWTIADTKKDQLQISLHLQTPHSPLYSVLISGKPNPIPWNNFAKYYL